MATKGRCSYCNKKFTKQGMGRHLSACKEIKKLLGDGQPQDSSTGHSYFNLIVESKDKEDYWMHILIREDATLELLDDFFRGIWLECCGHMSVFFIEYYSFFSGFDDVSQIQEMPNACGMKFRLGDLLCEGMRFNYDYDLGTTSELGIRVRDYYTELPLDGAVYVMARNVPPLEGVPNSPRMGMCAYEGDHGFDYHDLMVEDYQVSDQELEDMLWDGDLDDKDIDPFDQDYFGEDFFDEELEPIQEEIDRTKDQIFKNILRADRPIVSTSLEYLLDRFTKEELKLVCKDFQIEKIDRLKKAEMVQTMARRMPSLYLERVKHLGTVQLNILKQLTKAGGRMYQEDLFKDDNVLASIWRAQMALMVFTGTETEDGKERLICYLPEEYLGGLKKSDWQQLGKVGRRNDLWVKLTKGLLYYYGMAFYGHLLDEVRRTSGQIIEEQEYLAVLSMHRIWFSDLEDYASYLVHEFVEEPDLLYAEIEESKEFRKDLGYKRLTREQILHAADVEYVKTPAQKAIRRYLLSNFSIEGKNADMEILNILDDFDMGTQPVDLIEDLSIQFDLDNIQDTNEFMQYLSNLYNQHRQWILLGYSPDELAKMEVIGTSMVFNVLADPGTPPGKATVYDFAKKKKVGRNDPCPCGSGKKFKKCCGR